ncbi:MAG: dockerin type I domain-containing protein [Porcipelethomonas sp.]
MSSSGIKGVTFGDIHSGSFGAYLSKVTIETPEVKEYKIDIPGGDGEIDMTEYFGGVRYRNRRLSFVFTLPQRNSQLLSDYSAMTAALHGKHFDSIILDDDPEYHYVGRVKVGSLQKGAVSKVTVECDCEPFKYQNVIYMAIIEVTGTEFPTGWLYGDVDGDGIVSSTADKAAIEAVVTKRSFESAAALRADFDFDGVVSVSDLHAFNNYVLYGSGRTFLEYVTASPPSLEFRGCKRATFDFGASPVNVTFARDSMTGGSQWELRIDNVPQFHMSAVAEHSVILSGIHEIMIVTPSAEVTGKFTAQWSNPGTI